MVYCAICENEFSDSKMTEVISKKGITKVCSGCYRDDMPVFKKPAKHQFDGVYKRKSVYERLSQAAGLKDPDEHKKRISDFGKESSGDDGALRRLVNRNFQEKAKAYPKNEDLINNFHWVVMRARRSMKISQKQLAERIREPESAVSMAEKGFIPEGSDNFVRKLEGYLRVRISKKNFDKAKEGILDEEVEKEALLKKFEDKGEFDEEMMENLNVSDLNEYKKKKKKWWQLGKKKSDSGDSDEDVSYEDLGESFGEEEK
jgi:ribosome-binding protein aMBF1 (putative translation factor)